MVEPGSFASTKLSESDTTFVADNAGLVIQHFGMPKVVITGMGSAVGREFTHFKDDVTTIAIQDQWGARFDEWAGKYTPTYFVTNDSYGVDITQRAWRDMEPSHILPLGFPTLDRLARINPAKEEVEVRQRLSIGEKIPIIYYSAQFAQSGRIMHAIVEGLNRFKREVVVVAGKHPRFPVEQFPEEAALWDSVPPLTRGKLFVGSQGIEAISLVAASRVVISGYSDAVTEACVLRKPAVSVMWPEVEQFYKQETKEYVPVYPLLVLNAVFANHIPDLLGDVLELALEENKSGIQRIVKANQEKAFTADGNSADRIADLVMSIR